MIQSVGSTLHDPTATQASPPRGDAMGKEAFLTMLVAQLKNQDPLNPMNGDQMAAQLAQFSSLEQLTEIKDLLTAQADAQQAVLSMANGTAAINLLGKTVVAGIPHLAVGEAGASPIEVDVGGTGGIGTLRVYDAAGYEVKAIELGELPGGKQTLEVGDALGELRQGDYTYSLEVVTAAGTSVEVQPLTRVRVDGVRYGEEGPVLTAGGINIPLGRIVEVVG